MMDTNGQSGINTYAVGEFAKVCAHPNEGEKFLGWYENGNLISGEAEYRFCVKKDTTLIAKFAQNTKTSKKENGIFCKDILEIQDHQDTCDGFD